MPQARSFRAAGSLCGRRQPRLRLGGKALAYGRSALEAYWQPRLASLVPTAFGLKEIAPIDDGVVLDYASYVGEPVRIAFTFSPEGKSAEPVAGPPPRPRETTISDRAIEA